MERHEQSLYMQLFFPNPCLHELFSWSKIPSKETSVRRKDIYLQRTIRVPPNTWRIHERGVTFDVQLRVQTLDTKILGEESEGKG